ncbi:hypothetical protein IAD21_05264 [Abditibacteriota bacterium]|nr:hypothetical protein IAD21_05264 [Abditibacteriota bacterium]
MSSRLELTLTPHELFALPPDTPPTGEAIRVEIAPSKNCWFFAEDTPSFFALARLVKGHSPQNNGERDRYRVFFRNEGRGENEIFCTGNLVVPKDSLSTEEMRQEAIGQPSLIPTARFWKALDLPFGVALHSNGSGEIIERRGQYEEIHTFNWCGWGKEERTPFFEWDTQEFHAFCRGLVQAPGSDLNFFLKWRRLSFEEKTALATRCENGDWEQLARLFSQALLLVFHYFVTHPDKKGLDVNLKWKSLSYRHKWDIGGWTWTGDRLYLYPKDQYPAQAYAGRLQEAIFQIVRPTFWLPPRPLCCYEWIEGHQWFDGENFVLGAQIEHRAEYGMPTLHEFMEAQLELRDFFRPYLSEGEIEALLNPESEDLLS